MTIESSMAELGSNGFDPSHRRMVPSSSGSGPNDKRDVTESPLLSFITCKGVREERLLSGCKRARVCHPVSFSFKGVLPTCPRLKGRLFCVHFISVSGTEPLTMHVKLYSISEISCFGLTLIFTESGFTAGVAWRRMKRSN